MRQYINNEVDKLQMKLLRRVCLGDRAKPSLHILFSNRLKSRFLIY